MISSRLAAVEAASGDDVFLSPLSAHKTGRSILISIAQCPARTMLHIGIRVAMIGLLVSLLRSLVGYFAILIGLFR
jgi:hypothetical protein